MNADIRLMEFQQGPKIATQHPISLNRDSVNIIISANGRSILIKVNFKDVEEGLADIVV